MCPRLTAARTPQGKELFDKIVALGHYSERDAAHIMEQVFSAISYLHSKGIAHRDLKPENLMSIGSGADESIKLADFVRFFVPPPY